MSWEVGVSFTIFIAAALPCAYYFSVRDEKRLLAPLYFFFSLVVALLGISYGLQISIDNAASAAVQNTLSILYQSYIWLLVVAFGFYLIFTLKDFILGIWIRKKEKKDEQY